MFWLLPSSSILWGCLLHSSSQVAGDTGFSNRGPSHNQCVQHSSRMSTLMLTDNGVKAPLRMLLCLIKAVSRFISLLISKKGKHVRENPYCSIAGAELKAVPCAFQDELSKGKKMTQGPILNPPTLRVQAYLVLQSAISHIQCERQGLTVHSVLMPDSLPGGSNMRPEDGKFAGPQCCIFSGQAGRTSVE